MGNAWRAGCVLVLVICGGARPAWSGEEAELTHWVSGFSRVEISPREPVRLSGYGNRSEVSEGADTPLYVRCWAFRSGVSADDPSAGPLHVLLSIDSIGLSGSLVSQIADRLMVRHELAREQIVFCSTHTHCAPSLVGQLENIFTVPMSEAEMAAAERYTDQLIQGVLDAVPAAIAAMTPVEISWASGHADFAANRRLLRDGKWAGFSVQSGAAVDHSVPVLRIADASGKVQGIVFNYACHGTTMGGDYNRINAEWSGYAATNLEQTFPGAVALSTIGCGADANPEPRGALQWAEVHGRSLAAEVTRIVRGEMRPIGAAVESRFDYAPLSFDLPSIEEIHAWRGAAEPQLRRHAENLLEILEREGRLPATYPVPIQAWKFGDELTMVFLGGEVVADYALRLYKELPDTPLWVTSYANDVLGYICSERMREEGGYEVQQSGVYYDLPGPWESGTEDLLISRIERLLRSQGRPRPVEPEASLGQFHISDGYKIELVAAEPLVTDPINIAFGADGRLWVVEMGDYPEGIDTAPEGIGRIKFLSDQDGDGSYDTATVFLKGVSFPTGVFPWRNGVIVSAAPEIFYAEDRDGDGAADHRETLYSGFALDNPQHRINGFSYALDHSLHCASGDNLGEILCERTGEVVNASGHDVQIWPDSGRLNLVSGRSQFIRSRNAWGEWFGSDNSRPMYHYPIESRYLQRNPHVAYPTSMHFLFDPPTAPPVYPVSEPTRRFNDLFAANRFTSACSAIVVDRGQMPDVDQDAVIVCEPVHNLVHRSILVPDGATYRSERIEGEAEREFLASEDPWCRPVRAVMGPDGDLWVVDMYRESIEHPEWIPQAWQQQLDLRAGADRGRIYRISPESEAGPQVVRVDTMDVDASLGALGSRRRGMRDLVHQHLIESADAAVVPKLDHHFTANDDPIVRVHLLYLLRNWNGLTDAHLLRSLASSDVREVVTAVQLSEPRVADSPRVLMRVISLADHGDARVRLRVALALGETDAPAAGETLAQMVSASGEDSWVRVAIASSMAPHAALVAERTIARLQSNPEQFGPGDEAVLVDALVTMWGTGRDPSSLVADLLADGDAELSTRLRLAAAFTAALSRHGGERASAAPVVRPLYDEVLSRVQDEGVATELRCQAMSLLGLGLGADGDDRRVLLDLLRPASPLEVQLEAVETLAKMHDPQAASGLVRKWPELSQTLRERAISHMLASKAWNGVLVDALESGEIRANDLTPAALQQLRATGDDQMQARTEQVLGTTGTEEKRALVERYLQSVAGPVDRQRGRELYVRHCAVCHEPGPDGQAVGASLANLTDRSPRVLVESILDPNRSVDPKYQSTSIQTIDQRVLVGVIESEAGASITLAHADGKRTVIARQQIEGLRSAGVSLMPEGFEGQLSPEQMRDLVGWLADPGEVRP